jgi:hypothetical protein
VDPEFIKLIQDRQATQIEKNPPLFKVDSFLFVVKDWGVGYLTELRGGYPKKGVASGVIFLMEALNDVLRNTRIICKGRIRR